MDFQHYVDKRNEILTEGISPDGREAMREIQIVINETLSQTPRVNGFGINEIKFELINEEKATQGTQLNLEAKGSAIAKNKDHINGMLQKLVQWTREPLWKKKIFLEIMYHEIDVRETANENEDIAMGLKHPLYFNVVSAALVFA